MMSEESKAILEHFVKQTVKQHGEKAMENFQDSGPVKIIGIMLDRPFTGPTKGGKSITPAYYEDLEANRQEAEQYLGGLLGMA